MSTAVATAGKPGQRARGRLWRDLGGLLKEFFLAHPLASLGLIAVLLIGNASTGLFATASGGLVDALTAGPSGRAAAGHPALFWLAVYVVASALEEFYWTFKNAAANYLRDQGAYRIQRQVLARAAAAPLIQFEEGEFFEHLQRAAAGMGERLATLYQGLVDLGQILVMLTSIAVALYVVQPLLLPLLALGALPSVWLQARVAAAVYRAQHAHSGSDRIRVHLQRLLTGREAAAEVRLFGSAGFLLGRWRELRTARTRDILGAEQQRAVSATVGSLVSGMAYAGALVLVAFLILRGKLSVGNYVTVASGALTFSSILGGLIALLRGMEEHSQFLGDLFDFWRVAREETSLSDSLPGAGREHAVRSIVSLGRGRAGDVPDSNRPPKRVPPPAMGEQSEEGHHPPTRVLSPRAGERVRERGLPGILVEAEHLRFAYPGSGRPVLRDVSLRVERGERIAIVGENGAGKTTLAKVLIGLYQPDAGGVRLDGTLLGTAQAVGARRRIAAVFQDYATFQLTARESIGFGDLAGMADDARLKEAARGADIGDLIAGLPGGLDAYLGREFGETDLSGGQWQRIALARAFFRDADLLVLDEPTAALDPLAELAIFERFAELAAGRTAVMISHRLGAARVADRVIVLQEGVIVEEGHHDTLIAQGGVYAALFAAQAQWYR
jgi:ATP-binding cassette, subfamily B, bacterial